MRRILSTAIISTGLLLATPALAKNSKKFENTLGVPVDSVRIEVSLSEDMEWRANNLPKNRKDRGNIRSLRDGFGGNGYYGEKDLDRLVERLETRLAKRLEKEGVVVDKNSENVLRVTLADARPTRPTFKQRSRSSSLSNSSIGSGGASFSAQIIANNGEAQGDISYAYYENNICDAPAGTTWSDTNRAIDRFARRTAKSLAWD